MQIPAFIDRNKTKSERASARLRYVLISLSVQHTGRHSMRALAELVGLDHSTLSTYIRKGGFSESAATRIVTAIPTCDISVDELMRPLTVGKAPKD